MPGLRIRIPGQSKNQARRTSRYRRNPKQRRTLSDWLAGRGHRVSQAHQGNARRCRASISVRHRHLQRMDLPGAPRFCSQKAEVWWRALAGTGVPHTSTRHLEREDEIAWPSHIRVAPDGKYLADCRRRIDGVDYDINLRADWRSQPKPQIEDTGAVLDALRAHSIPWAKRPRSARPAGAGPLVSATRRRPHAISNDDLAVRVGLLHSSGKGVLRHVGTAIRRIRAGRHA